MVFVVRITVLGLPQDAAHTASTKTPKSLVLRARTPFSPLCPITLTDSFFLVVETRKTYRAVFSEPKLVIPEGSVPVPVAPGPSTTPLPIGQSSTPGPVAPIKTPVSVTPAPASTPAPALPTDSRPQKRVREEGGVEGQAPSKEGTPSNSNLETQKKKKRKKNQNQRDGGVGAGGTVAG